MRQLSITPSITVTIGCHTRQYFAFVTTAPAALDSPATVTLHAGPFAEVIGLAADPVANTELRAHTPARLVLVEALELAWQRAKYRGHQYLLLTADPDSWASTHCSTGCGRSFSSRLPEAITQCGDFSLRRHRQHARHDGELFRRTHRDREDCFQREDRPGAARTRQHLDDSQRLHARRRCVAPERSRSRGRSALRRFGLEWSRIREGARTGASRK